MKIKKVFIIQTINFTIKSRSIVAFCRLEKIADKVMKKAQLGEVLFFPSEN